MNLENLNVVELDAQEKVNVDGGEWWGVLFDLYYGGGAGQVHYNCGQAVNGHLPYADQDASEFPEGPVA